MIQDTTRDMIHTLIVPCLTKNIIPVFTYDRDTCVINCVKAISGMDLSNIDEVYFIILDDMDYIYNLAVKISADANRILRRDIKFEVITLPEMTASPAETVYEALQRIGDINNRTLFIKDGDASFHTHITPLENAVMTASLEECSLVDSMHKSYIKLDEQGFVTNCIEKRVISDKFIAGGYSFRNAELFTKAYEALKNISYKFYISDVIFWLILNENEKFRPVTATNFKDFNI